MTVTPAADAAYILPTLESFRNKLLDLTTRNNLLNPRPGRQRNPRIFPRRLHDINRVLNETPDKAFLLRLRFCLESACYQRWGAWLRIQPSDGWRNSTKPLAPQVQAPLDHAWARRSTSKA